MVGVVVLIELRGACARQWPAARHPTDNAENADGEGKPNAGVRHQPGSGNQWCDRPLAEPLSMIAARVRAGRENKVAAMIAAGFDRPSKPNNTPQVEKTHESKASRIMHTERAAQRAITDLNY
jgi:hypothetical protein